ncbi:uncharacterized protein [Arachis hypogaea]|uniref:uncharacterized protein n=1 Tax=Arachis hypogaea TaxID=3818 RepID=UPI000DED34D6|nr:uncharacterized protein LOC112756625 [Arachis hypogaea]
MASPKTVKEVQRLTGRLAALSRFVPCLASTSIPFFQTIKKKNRFEWNDDCEKAFSKLKTTLSQPPILQKPLQGEDLFLYLSVTDWAISSALVSERNKVQHPIYFVSKTLQHAELNYPRIEKLALALIFSARRLRPYFQSHVIYVRTDHPLRQVLHKPEIAGRLIKWAVELSEFDIRYQSRGPIKSQFLADFIAEFTTPSEEDHAKQWILYVDGSSNNGGCGVGIRLEAEDGFILEHSIHFAFKASNNQSEYEALLAGLRLCLDLQISTIKNLKINQHFASVEHPQTNGLAEAANKVILHALKKKLDDAKGLWAELIPEVLWGYNTTPQTSTKETPFRLVYGSEAMIPLEISQNSIRTYMDNQDEARKSELDIIEEIRDIAALKQRAAQQVIARQYNKSVKSRSFVKGGLVLRKTETARKPPKHGKLAANWDGPYRVSNVLGQGAYKLESLDGKLMPSTWNVSSLKKFYS